MQWFNGESSRRAITLAAVLVVAVLVAVGTIVVTGSSPPATPSPVAPAPGTPFPGRTHSGEERDLAVSAATTDRQEATRRSEATKPPRPITITGLATLASGRPVACTLRAYENSSRPDDAVLGATDANGRFELRIPRTWKTLEVVGETNSGAHGFTRSQAIHAEDLRLVLRRMVDVTLRLHSSPTIRVAAGNATNCVARVLMDSRGDRSFFTRPAIQQVATFDIDRSAQQTTTVSVDCAENNRLTWLCGPADSQPSLCQSETIPAGNTTFESEYAIDVGMMMIVTIVDTSGQPLPHVRFLAWSDEKVRRMVCHTDANGRCIRIVPPGDHGRLELPWRYAPWLEGGDQWQQDAECPTWTSGIAVRSIADVSNVLRVRFKDWQGDPVSSFQWSLHNNGSRGLDGEAALDFGERAVDVAYLHSRSKLAKGSAIFVTVPRVGECYAVADKDLTATAGVHTLALQRPTPQTLAVRMTDSFPVKTGGWVTLQLRTEPMASVPKSYMISFTRTSRSQEVLVRDVLPGTYTWHTSAGAQTQGQQKVVLMPGRKWAIDLN